MITIRTRSNAAEIVADLKRKGDAVPFAVVVALTRTAKAAQAEIKREMQRVFDRPTRYTLNAVAIKPATRERLQASVYLRDDYQGGTNPSNYLDPQIVGGTRKRKAMERALERLLVVPSGWYLVPGSAARLDAYGNWSAGEIRQVLSWFNAAEMTSGYSANLSPARRAKLKRGTRARRGFEYFAVRPGDRAAKWLRPGIYRKTFFAFGGAVQPVAQFVSTVSYRPRLDFYGVAERVARAVFPAELARARRR